MVIKFTDNETGNPAGKLADAEVHFTDGPLAGLKLIGFAIWQQRVSGKRTVTFPSRQYSVNGERRSFALLRPVGDDKAREAFGHIVLDAYTVHLEGQAESASEVPV